MVLPRHLTLLEEGEVELMHFDVVIQRQTNQRTRVGERITLYDMGARHSATIVDPVFIDKAGERLRA